MGVIFQKRPAGIAAGQADGWPNGLRVELLANDQALLR
jgi:hypothetical protein